MSRQIQIRRGTAAEHENFTGAIGEITMDTTNKTLRVHDGETAGGTALAKSSQLPPASADYVIETQLPTAENDYTWYRKYKSGWVEQGGILAIGNLGDGAADAETVSLVLTMSDAVIIDYSVRLARVQPQHLMSVYVILAARPQACMYAGVSQVPKITVVTIPRLLSQSDFFTNIRVLTNNVIYCDIIRTVFGSIHSVP